MAQLSLRGTAVVIWAALVGGVAIFSGVALLVPLGRPADPALAVVLLQVALAMTLVSLVLSFWIPRRMRPGGAVVAPDQLALSRTVVAGALCEGPALFAVVGFMVSREAGMLLPWALSLGGLLFHFPGTARWERLRAGAAAGGAGGSSSGGAAPGGGAAPPNRMVR